MDSDILDPIRNSIFSDSQPEVNNQAEENAPVNSIANLAFLDDFIHSRLDDTNTSSSISDEDRLYLLNCVCKSLRNIFIPVSICMFLVVFIIANFPYVENNYGVYFLYTPLREESANSVVQRAGFAIANSLIVVGVVTAMTFLIVLLYYCECYRIIKGWLMFSTFTILIFLSATFFQNILSFLNIQVDLVTFCFFIFNFGITGIISIHWKGPQIVNQFYLIFSSVLVALTFIKYLPDWTSWVFLALIALYDILAVLCPGGPLNLLINMVQRRNKPILEGLLYETWLIISAVRPNSHSGDESEWEGDDIRLLNLADDENTNAQERANRPKFTGFKLGLGDFIFYSVLMGKTSVSGDYSATFSCYLAIITGLFATMIVLMIWRRALPALPISIMLGIGVSFASKYLVSPMMFYFTSRAVFL